MSDDSTGQAVVDACKDYETFPSGEGPYFKRDKQRKRATSMATNSTSSKV